jgi:RND superfamily putative drug exporter
MATVLYRLGRFSYRRRGLVALLWLFVLALAGVGAATLQGPTSGAFSIPGTESQRATELLSERMPQAAEDGAVARVVFTADDGTLTDPGPAAAIATVTEELRKQPKVAAVTDALQGRQVSQDLRTGFTTVDYAVSPLDLTEADHEELLRIGRTAEPAGVTVEFTGTAVREGGEEMPVEAIGIAVAAVVLAITFGALLAAGLPLLTAVVGVGLGVLGIAIASGFFELSGTTQTLAVMLGLAVGIDYALFIVSRYRHELLAGRDGEEAAGRALGTAGSAVVFAGLTVVIALAALTVVGIPFLAQMGLAAAGTVAGAVVIALTLLPALLGYIGPRILGRRGTAAKDTESDAVEGGRPAMGERWATAVVRRRWLTAAGSLLVLGVVAVPAADLRMALPSDGTASHETTQRRAYDNLSLGFGPGTNGPLAIVADLAAVPAADRKAAVATVQSTLTGLDGVAMVMPAAFNPAGDTAVLSLIPGSGPSDEATETLVHAIRGQAGDVREQTGATMYVTGQTAVNIDVSEKLAEALLPYLAVVVGLAFVLLTLVFRSLLVPLKATLGFLLSVAATFGAVVAVFQYGWLAELIGVDTTGPIVSFLPVLLIGILFGLAMDYEVFLVTRMREEHVHGADADHSVVLGFRHGARVVTAAAVIMISVFAGFVLTDDPIIKSIGFALAFGVLVDAFVVRMTLVPAVMSLLGNRAWWLPAWLDRVLPDVDVEGEKLTRSLEERSHAAPHLPTPREGARVEEPAGRH